MPTVSTPCWPVSGTRPASAMVLASHQHLPYPAQLRQKVVAAGQGAAMPASLWIELAEAITEVQAEAVQACDPEGKADLVGCHGQPSGTARRPGNAGGQLADAAGTAAGPSAAKAGDP